MNGKFCKIKAPLQPLANPPSCTAAIYAKNNARSNLSCSVQIRNTHSATIPTPIASNLWILTSTTELDWEGIMCICPDQAPKSIKVQKPIRVLCLPPACSATSQHFHLPPHFENHQMTINISLNTANLKTMNIFITCFEYGNTWRIIGMRPNYINWLTCPEFLLLLYTSI